jgi:peptidoglycan/xylan/chitin deacetylase (PgdA/CDA1 family)
MSGVLRSLRRWLHRGNALVPTESDGVSLLTYHLVGGDTNSPVDIPLEMFKAHLEQVQPLATTLDGALEHLQTRASGTRVVLTFDDAFENFFQRAWPLLRTLRIPSVLYVPTDFVDERAPSPLLGAPHLRACSWEQLREVAASGLVEIGSHSRSHQDLDQVSSEVALAEVLQSNARLHEELGQSPTSFCYPRGRRSARVAAIVRRTYHTAVVRGGRKQTAARWSPWELERVPIRRDGPIDVLDIVSHALWLEEWVATSLHRLRRPGTRVAGHLHSPRRPTGPS